MGIDIGEVRQLSFDLGRAGLKATTLASQAVRKTALDIEADAKALAPVDTGNLKGSISVDSLGPLAAEIGPTATYGIFQEYGTSRMPPQPFMGPAFDRRSPGLVAAMEQIADEVL
jgi:HK97 gp10 family phage protein